MFDYRMKRQTTHAGKAELPIGYGSPAPTRAASSQPVKTVGDHSKRRVWIVSEIYYPEETGTGYFVTRIAEGLQRYFPVRVLCGQPAYGKRGVRAARCETRHGVRIQRCLGTTLDKDVLPLRLINTLTITASLFMHAAFLFSRGDVVIVVTAPPILPFLVALACRIRGAKCVLRVDDVYPETLIAAGMLRRDSVGARTLHLMNQRLYCFADRICVLGRDMEALIHRKMSDHDHNHVVVIQNWADVDEVAPIAREDSAMLKELGLADKFVVQYAGNIGRVQAIEGLFEAARRVAEEDSQIHFLFIGDGAKKQWLERAVSEAGLANVTILDSRPRCEQGAFLNACDIAIMALVSGMNGVAVPSRTYNIMAAGKPIIAAVDASSEIALVVRENGVGWIVPASEPNALAEAVLAARRAHRELPHMGKRARQVAAKQYTMDRAIDGYRSMIAAIG